MVPTLPSRAPLLQPWTTAGERAARLHGAGPGTCWKHPKAGGQPLTNVHMWSGQSGAPSPAIRVDSEDRLKGQGRPWVPGPGGEGAQGAGPG